MNSKIEKAFLERLMQNGGHWVELTMKATGKKVYVQRLRLSSFENPTADQYDVTMKITNWEKDDIHETVNFKELIEILAAFKK